MTSEAEFPWDMPGEREEASIRIVLDHPVNPWEHEGAGSIWWGANLDRLAPLAEEAVSIIREAWERRGEGLHDRARREREESEPVEREPVAGPSITPGWAARIEPNQYWIRLTLYRPGNPRWEQQEGENWARGQLVNDGILERGVTVEATTDLGRRALRIIEALHGPHPFGELERPATQVRPLLHGDFSNQFAGPAQPQTSCVPGRNVDATAS